MSRITRQTFVVGIIVFSFFSFVANHAALAGALPASDELVISIGGPTGPPIFDTLIPEIPGPGAEDSALFAPGTGLPALQPQGALPGIVPPGFPGLAYVILTEPAGEPPDPSELPPVIYSGPNGPIVVSDVVITNLIAPPPGPVAVPPFVALVSDNNPDLAAYVAAMPPGVPVLVETGSLQDVTSELGSPFIPGVGPIDVQVLSDARVPEPSTFAMAALGLGALTAWGWRLRRFS